VVAQIGDQIRIVVLVANRRYHRDKLEGVRVHSTAACPRGGVNWQPDAHRGSGCQSWLPSRRARRRAGAFHCGLPAWWRKLVTKYESWFWLPIVATIETSSKACECIPLRLARVVAKIGNQRRVVVLVANRRYHRDKLEGVRVHSTAACPRGGVNWQPDAHRGSGCQSSPSRQARRRAAAFQGGSSA